MNKSSSMLKEANFCFKNGDYQDALRLYREVEKVYGTDIVHANIIMCENRLRKNKSKKESSFKVSEISLNELQVNKSNHESKSRIDAEKFIYDSIRNYKDFETHKKGISNIELPKVSYIVTSYNAEDTIDRAINSLLMQNYPNLEVVICDDNSSDKTWDKLKKIKDKAQKAVKIFRCNVNGGTYLAKNIAIDNCDGEVVLFQDADDYSHPDRTMIQIYPLVKDSNLIATRTKYARFNPDTKGLITVGDNLSKYGLITLAVRKSAFKEIGFFDSVRKAGDDEWFQRLRHLYGRQRIKHLDVSLYLAELRENSLVSDMITFNNDGSVNQSSSLSRKQYVKIFQANYSDKDKRRQWYRNVYQPYRLRAIRNYPEGIASLEPIKEKVIGTACCIPERIESFKVVVSRILPQLDHLYVYLDKFSKVPDFLNTNKKITVKLSSDFETDYRDNAKFLFFDKLKQVDDEFYYFTFDDDILYPHDYVRAMINRSREFSDNIVLGVHGVLYEENPKKYFRRRVVYHFQETELDRPLLVNNLGTGTVMFHSKNFDSLDPNKWLTGGMVDIYFSKECRRNKIAMICVDRHSDWLKETNESIGSPNLFNEYKVSHKESKILSELKSMTPWGYKGIKDVLDNPIYINSDIKELLPNFLDDISISQFFKRYR